jgi:hypothetical protein
MSKKLDQLETFFLAETSKIIGLYEQIKSMDPRGGPISEANVSLDDEIDILKGAWATLISYAKIYGYTRFANVDPCLEKFYMEKIDV